MKKPNECADIHEIRAEIDRIDRKTLPGLVNHFIAEEMSQWQKQSDGESE